MADIPEIAPFDPTKKKKKKKKVVMQHHVDKSLHSSVEREDMLPFSEGRRDAFLGLTKEKSSVGTTLLDYNTDAAVDLRGDSAELDEEEDALVRQFKYPWEESQHEYEYTELLQRLFGFLHEDNPQLTGDRRRTVLRPLQALPEGSTKTVFVNLIDLCQTMHRQPQQVITFMLTKLGTSGSLDGENRLVVRGRFTPESLEAVLQKYINEYVLCHTCRTPDTLLSKENHILLQCELCGSERFVAPIGAACGTRERRKIRTSKTGM